jgi:hypothetical protein
MDNESPPLRRENRMLNDAASFRDSKYPAFRTTSINSHAIGLLPLVACLAAIKWTMSAHRILHITNHHCLGPNIITIITISPNPSNRCGVVGGGRTHFANGMYVIIGLLLKRRTVIQGFFQDSFQIFELRKMSG